jgi:small neutral amino acid transporter SnatA (MarC family)
MDEQNELNKDQIQSRMAQINRALGLFISFFAVVVLISIFWTETPAGKITNLGAGLILAVVAIVMILKSKSKSSDS